MNKLTMKAEEERPQGDGIGDEMDAMGSRNDVGFDNDDALSDEDAIEESTKEKKSQKKKASINFYSYEFDHIIKGKKGA
jgi:hypothetical protein